jgi:hypothetical protein
LNSVVFPLPLAPISPTRSPRSTARFNLSNSVRRPKVFSMLMRLTTGMGLQS